MEHALSRGLAGVKALLFGDLNDHLVQPRDQHGEDLKTAIANNGIVDQSLHFIPRQRYKGKRS